MKCKPEYPTRFMAMRQNPRMFHCHSVTQAPCDDSTTPGAVIDKALPFSFPGRVIPRHINTRPLPYFLYSYNSRLFQRGTTLQLNVFTEPDDITNTLKSHSTNWISSPSTKLPHHGNKRQTASARAAERRDSILYLLDLENI